MANNKLFLKFLLFCFVLVNEAMAGVCPPPGEISPCTCSDLGSEGLVIQLQCHNTAIEDEKASEILDKMIQWPRVSSLRRLELSNNRLTRVPSQLSQFQMLNYVDLSANQISSIEANAFNLVTTFNTINLASNPITSIQDEAFKGNSL